MSKTIFFKVMPFAIFLAGCGDLHQAEASSPVVDKHVITERDPETTSQLEDEPESTNDESNDQPIGEYGTITLCIRNPRNGHRYTLDADINDHEVTSVYFPKGGNVDFTGCELDDDLIGECTDDYGKDWEFEGEC